MSNAAQKLIVDNKVSKGIALIVDDEPTNRLILQAHLTKSGYDVVLAVNGLDAVEKFETESPDIIFMDVMMPEMNGYDATIKIKELSADRFIPVIFLTAITNEEELAKCVEAGGDDFLTKPFSYTLLKAKVEALERVRDLHREVKHHHEQILHDEEIAEELFTDVVMAENVELEHLQVMLRPAVTFSGDILMSARSPSGDLYVILGDFTGHGLVASIGALPVSEIFRAMTKKGFALNSILKEMNKKLEHLLPGDKFLAVGAISISRDVKTATVWNGGIPSIIHLSKNKEIINRFPAEHLALGIIDEIDGEKPIQIDLNAGDALVLYTDGVIEATDPDKNMFGEERFENHLTSSETSNVLVDIEKDLIGFTEGYAQDDDISMVIIPCTENIAVSDEKETIAENEDVEKSIIDFSITDDENIKLEWQWDFNAYAASLSRIDPVPVLISQIQELEEIKNHRQNLFLILSELFNNALDHGILGLDSKMKSDPDGFTEYLEKRETGLESLTNENILITIEKFNFYNSEYLKINIKDSGDGFDMTKKKEDFSKNKKFSGRGIQLVKELCFHVEYKGNGNEVEVVYQL